MQKENVKNNTIYINWIIYGSEMKIFLVTYKLRCNVTIYYRDFRLQIYSTPVVKFVDPTKWIARIYWTLGFP